MKGVSKSGRIAPAAIAISLGMLTHSASAATPLTRAQFVDAVPQHRLEGFDAVPIGSTAPLKLPSGLVMLASQAPDQPSVLASLVGLPNTSWFQGNGSPPNFVIVNSAELRLQFPADTFAFGIELGCFACGSGNITLDLLDHQGSVVGTVRLLSPFSAGERFIGASSSAAFRQVRISRSDAGNWLVDSARWYGDRLFASGFETEGVSTWLPHL